MFKRSLLPVIAAALVVPESNANSLEEVVVTARKRNETLEDAPVSVRAFTEREIRSAGIDSPQDFVNMTPNATLVQTQNAGNSFLNIRGVSQARNSDLSAAVLVDGVLSIYSIFESASRARISGPSPSGRKTHSTKNKTPNSRQDRRPDLTSCGLHCHGSMVSTSQSVFNAGYLRRTS